MRVIFLSKPLTRGKAKDFASRIENPLAIEYEYNNGKNRKTKFWRFVKIVATDIIILDKTYSVNAQDVKKVSVLSA